MTDLLRSEKPDPGIAKARKIGKWIVLFGALAGLWAAAEIFAYNTGFWPELNGCINGKLCDPFHIFIWRFYTFAEDPGLNDIMKNTVEGGLYTFGIFFLIGAIPVAIAKSKLTGLATLHGSARWATLDEITQMGLIKEEDKKACKDAHQEGGKPSVYVGGYWDPKKKKTIPLKHSGPEHILCYAPTRSGKGVGLVIPTLLTWNESAVITDLKGELWALTAGYRKGSMNQKVIRFEPAAIGSAKWNPLNEIRVGTAQEVGDAQNLANMIVDPDGKGLEGQDAHWKKTAFALYTSLILHVMYKQRNGDLKDERGNKIEASMRVIDNFLSDPKTPIAELWKDMMEYRHIRTDTAGNPLPESEWRPHPVVSAGAKEQSERPKDEGGSVLSTVKSNLSLYRDPIVTENTSATDFKIRDIMNCKTAVSVYVVTQPNDKTRLKPLIRIFVNMTVRLLADKMKFVNGRAESCNKHRLLMMLDEFPSLGKLDVMQESLAFVAGYGIKCYLICQDLSQLRADYGQNESITSNCHIQNAYPPNRPETAKHLSEMTGTTTIVKKSVTKSGKNFFDQSKSVTMQETQRALLTPDECLRLPGPKKTRTGEIETAGDMLIFVAGYPAIYGKQTLYFQDEVFNERSKTPAPEVTDKIADEDREEETASKSSGEKDPTEDVKNAESFIPEEKAA